MAQLESLRIVITAGESLPLELVRSHYQLLPHATLYNEYGPTEATVWCSVYQTTREEAGARVPIGKPINNMQLYVLDAHLEPVPVGVPGELYVAGDCLARGYMNQPQLTRERFLAHPHVADARLYRTGDRARYREDGNVEFLGRVDQQVKLRGYRIELGEVEYVLSNAPGVYQAAVLLRQDKPEQQRLVGYVTGQPELKAMLDQIRSYVVGPIAPIYGAVRHPVVGSDATHCDRKNQSKCPSCAGRDSRPGGSQDCSEESGRRGVGRAVEVCSWCTRCWHP